MEKANNYAESMKVVLMMYDGSLNYLNKAKEFMAGGDIRSRNIYANKTRDIVKELGKNLDYEAGGEMAENLSTFYKTVDMLLDLSTKRDDGYGLDQAYNMLSGVKESWEFISQQNAA